MALFGGIIREIFKFFYTENLGWKCMQTICQ